MSERKRFIRLPEVLERTGFCKAWIYRLISRGQFPAPIKLGDRAIRFVESEVDEWIDQISGIRIRRSLK
ncbi:helix-turn-helix transcriptional regulator [Klebsiella quasipneumoniae]|uniref:helix-turn-helix transcriptional regulator n=1 Tax=Klebsiella quasipneumoniae TaxID=1463165 RepID=UPI001F3F4C47|nr:AlpA family transcriptional regulator [Klebsiella quasipneumoniae]